MLRPISRNASLAIAKVRRTGLGLSMSYDIVVKQHGGKIDVDTEPGVFTEFTITLTRTLAAQGNTGGPH